MSTKLYEEAIAEAKQLRELAEQNAKNALIEAVTPRIKGFIENQLLGDADDTDDNDSILSGFIDESTLTGEDVELSESEVEALAGLISESPRKDELLSIINKIDGNPEDLKELFMQRTKGNRDDFIEIDLEDDLLTEEASETSVDEYSLEEIVAMLAEDDDDDDNSGPPGSKEEDILRELEEAMLRLNLDLGDDVDLPDDWIGTVDVTEEEPEEGEAEPGAEDLEGEEDEEAELDALLEPEEEEGEAVAEEKMITISESDLRREIRSLKQGLKTQSERKLRKLAEQYKKNNKTNNEGRQNRALRGQLAEYRRATQSLRKQLTEMNLFNAKLLYVNKLLQNKGVSAGQRRSIIESIDNAKTLREVQILYKGITNSISKSKTLSESTVRKTLGSSSRVIKSASPRSTASTEVDRWAVLAGLSEKD